LPNAGGKRRAVDGTIDNRHVFDCNAVGDFWEEERDGTADAWIYSKDAA
jgi:hypothetical protein